MTDFENFLKDHSYEYRVQDDVFYIKDSLYVGAIFNLFSGNFPSKIVVEGNYAGFYTYGDFPKEVKVKRLFIYNKPTEPFKFECEDLMIYEDVLDEIPNEHKDNCSIFLRDTSVWSIIVSKDFIHVGCKKKTIEEWKEFFENKQFYQTDPNSSNYLNLIDDFNRSIEVYNKYFK